MDGEPVHGRGGWGGRGAARLLAVGAVLFGLFLMHGAPAMAAGCHGGMPSGAVTPEVVPGEGVHAGGGAPSGAALSVLGMADGAHAAMGSAPPAVMPAPVPVRAGQSAEGKTPAPVSAHAAHVAGPYPVMCVSTGARDRTPLPAAGLVAVAAPAAGAVAGWLSGGRPTGMRGPPPGGGRGVLLRVCVART